MNCVHLARILLGELNSEARYVGRPYLRNAFLGREDRQQPCPSANVGCPSTTGKIDLFRELQPESRWRENVEVMLQRNDFTLHQEAMDRFTIRKSGVTLA